MDGEVSPAEVKRLLDDGAGDPTESADVRVVDIRSREAFDRGHIPGSECIPFSALPGRVEELDGADRVITVCPKGKSSVRAARLLASYGGLDADARVESMAGGLSEWEFALERNDADDAGDVDAPF